MDSSLVIRISPWFSILILRVRALLWDGAYRNTVKPGLTGDKFLNC